MIDYTATLNEAQYEAVTSGDGPVLVVAGAGSGKTRTIIYRLAWLVEHGTPPESILLLTFTRKAAHEMLHRAGLLLGAGLSRTQGGTFHAFAYGALRANHPLWLNGRPFTLMDASDITDAIRHCKEALKLGRGDRSFPKTQTIAGFFSKARNKELPLADVLEREAFHLLPHSEALVSLEVAYTAWRREKGLFDYDDLLFELEGLLADETAARILRRRFTHILVDEYQDTNRVQARITRLLAGVRAAGEVGADPCNVMAVGDEAQSIYAFRGADVRNILDFQKIFPGTRVIRLEENYRSTKPVLEVANSLLANAAESFHKTLFTRTEGGDPVRLVMPLSDMSEATLVVRRIRELLDIYLPHEIAVLFRAGFHSYHLEMALQQAGIAFRKYGGLRYTEAAHVKDIVAYARLVLNLLDMPAFARVAALHSGIGPKTVQKVYAALSLCDPAITSKALARYPGLQEDIGFVDKLRALQQKPEDIFSAVLEHYFPKLEFLYPDDWPRRRQGLEEIIQMAAGYAELDIFVADLALESPEADGSDNENRITLSTVHSAKGLEWNAVLIIDLVEDRFPSRHALARPDDFEEERRLMYVACTRARKNLDLYAPASIYSRATRGNLYVSQSPFVRELPLGLAEEWVESLGGTLTRRKISHPARSPHPSCDSLRNTEGEPARSPACGACRHRIFGRGKIVKHLPPDKVQVNFPGFGLKIILAEYLLMED
ncbi:ATP-dependent helicase [Candidatus Desulfovibrio trichonymphae]|uniref:DNA 3'-5' helicase n=1 Tax=Candidatus Desulfovibrio trichonymphae TaxID=1725232 RepID=A0A1J1DV20_9BACT|nr:ATP-dependent helicase [Candidatus Desulfovibrio trichonymphae]BAV92581.1 DNA helicase II UvrD [Candidatus Desulfovibrio trichonymphae]